MPYDKEAIDRAKKLGVFERSIDAEALKTDEAERKKLAEKLKKHTSTLAPEMLAQGNVELVELPVRRDEIIEVELSIWDRIIIFLLSLLNVMSSNDYKKSKALRKIEHRLKSYKPVMIDFSKKYLSGDFGKVILSLYEQAKLIRNVFDVFLNNENLWKGVGVEKSSCEYLFENITDLANVVEKYKDLNLDFVTKLIEKSQSVKSAIRNIEDNINDILRSIPEDLIKKADNIFNNIVKLREFAYFDFETIVRRFSQTSDIKRGRISFKSIPPQGLTKYITDLESILLSLNVDDVYTLHYVKLMIDYIEKYSGTSDRVTEAKNKFTSNFFQNLNENIRKLNISDVVAYITRDPNHKPFVIKTNYSLFKEFSKIILERYKRIVIDKMEEKNNKMIDKYMNVIFGKPVEIQEFGIYSTNVSILFAKSGLPPFLYTKLLGISSYFMKNIWDAFVKDRINTLIVSGVFTEKQLQRTLSELFSKVEPTRNKMNDFVKAVEQGGEYYILLSRFITSPSLLANEANKKVIERKIIIMNSLCFEFLNTFKDIFKGIYKILEFISDDIYAPFPKTVTNIHRIGGPNNKDFIEGLEKSIEKLNAFSSLINLFIEE
ncbi:MAG: DUF5312 domain-containing protein [Brevinematales bacterium]|nr:DUF5312 domain-containing protein [Brevinematales bacterium]